MEFDPRGKRSREGEITRKQPVTVRAILFDFDGTLTCPGHLDFAAMRAAVGCPPGESLLTFVDSLHAPEERGQVLETLERFEAEAASRSEQDPDAAEVIRFCKHRGLKLGIITRNSRRSVDRSFENFGGIAPNDFDVIITREDPIDVKPAPDGIVVACRRMGVAPCETFVVGDYLYDVEAGERAGAVTVFYDSDPQRSFERPASDYAIARLGELPFLVSLHLPLPAGKVPNDMLAYFLAPGIAVPPVGSEGAAENAAAVIVGPGVGEDVAAVSLGIHNSEAAAGGVRPTPEAVTAETARTAGAGVLLLKSDPVTLVSGNLGRYLITINANDIATAGGTPRWLLATLLVPPGTLPVQIGQMFAELRSSCWQAGIALCGGHTELTASVTRPVISGTMIGTVPAARLLKKRAIQRGDLLLLTKGVAVEGTAILAEEHRELLLERGIDEEAVERAAGLAELMSVLPEARIASSHDGVAAMHDVTEGGIATALRELSVAGGHKLLVHLERIPILPETRAFCTALGLNPLGLIASGSLLICIRGGLAASLQKRLSEANIPVAVVGEVLEAGDGIDARQGDLPVDMPSFAADELTLLA